MLEEQHVDLQTGRCSRSGRAATAELGTGHAHAALSRGPEGTPPLPRGPAVRLGDRRGVAPPPVGVPRSFWCPLSLAPRGEDPNHKALGAARTVRWLRDAAASPCHAGGTARPRRTPSVHLSESLLLAGAPPARPCCRRSHDSTRRPRMAAAHRTRHVTDVTRSASRHLADKASHSLSPPGCPRLSRPAQGQGGFCVGTRDTPLCAHTRVHTHTHTHGSAARAAGSHNHTVSRPPSATRRH